MIDINSVRELLGSAELSTDELQAVVSSLHEEKDFQIKYVMDSSGSNSNSIGLATILPFRDDPAKLRATRVAFVCTKLRVRELIAGLMGVGEAALSGEMMRVVFIVMQTITNSTRMSNTVKEKEAVLLSSLYANVYKPDSANVFSFDEVSGLSDLKTLSIGEDQIRVSLAILEKEKFILKTKTPDFWHLPDDIVIGRRLAL